MTWLVIMWSGIAVFVIGMWYLLFRDY